MKKLLLSLSLALMASVTFASGGASYPLDKAPDLSNDNPALQRGAKLFVNYCLNCHGASSMRYNRLKDIGLSDEQIKANLLFSGEKVGDLMKAAINPAEAKAWFGATPPDLSVIARAKSSGDGSGADYIYTYLRTYYRDASRATGWNNLAFPSVGMPHVLWERQPARDLTTVEIAQVEKDKKKVWEKTTTVFDTNGVKTETKEIAANYAGHGEKTAKFAPAKDVAAAQAYDRDAAELTAFLSYIAEPAAKSRHALGIWVLAFLALFIVLAAWLNKLYWKDIR